MSQVITNIAVCVMTLCLFFACGTVLAAPPTHFNAGSAGSSGQPPLRLSGAWMFAPDHFIAPQDAVAAFDSNALPTIPVPSRWADHRLDAPNHTGTLRSATMIARLSLPTPYAPDALLTLPMIRDAFRVYWVPMDAPHNWPLLTEQGDMGAGPATGLTYVAVPLQQSGEGLLVFHITEKLANWGGIIIAPQVTSAARAAQLHTILMVLKGICAGALFLITLKNLSLLRRMPQSPAVLFLTIFSCAACVRTFATTGLIETILGTQWHLLRMRLELSAVPLLCCSGLALVQILLPFRPTARINYGFNGLGAVLLLVFLAAPSATFDRALSVTRIYVLCVLIPISVHNITHWRRNNPETRPITLAFFVLLLAALYDVWSSQAATVDLYLLPVGVIWLISTYSEAINRRTTAAIERTRILEQEKETLHHMHTKALHDARHDHLTGLLNRHAFDVEYASAWEETAASHQPLALVIFDIDHFKVINDTHGHPVGDRALAALATCLQSTALRSTDRLCRYGGEEFALILPDTTQSEAAGLAEHLRRAIAAAPILTAAPRLSLTCSFGLSATDMTEAPGPDALLAAADSALYAAKSQGRNRVNWPDKPRMSVA
ncbi:MAG: diguanylate cyclase [Shimia sp.]|nr:diguanylate cyclase [Shimia sp.]